MKVVKFISILLISLVIQVVLFLLLPIAHAFFFEFPERKSDSIEIVYELENMVKKKPEQQNKKMIRKISSQLKVQSPQQAQNRSFQIDLNIAAGDATGEGVAVGGGSISNMVYEAGEVDQEAMPLFDVQAKMPKRARREGVSGYVKLYLVIDTQGAPTFIQVVKVQPEGYGFENAAMEAMRKYRFKPAILNTVPVSQKVTKEFQFEFN